MFIRKQLTADVFSKVSPSLTLFGSVVGINGLRVSYLIDCVARFVEVMDGDFHADTVKCIAEGRAGRVDITIDEFFVDTTSCVDVGDITADEVFF